MDHYENPRNVGSLDATLKNVGTGLVGAPACGDVMKLQVGGLDGLHALLRLHRSCHHAPLTAACLRPFSNF
jgi:hypothetical protein